MSAFKYRAVTGSGKVKRGVLQADTAQEARRVLRTRKLTPTHLTEASSARSAPLRLPISQRAMMIRQLATLVGNGVRIEDALETLGAQEGQSRMSEICFSLRAEVLDGTPLSKAMLHVPGVFNIYVVASVAAGEDSAALGRVLQHLADHMDRRARNIRAVRLALLYPCLLLVVSILIVTGLLVFVVPDIVGAFSARGATLPALTRALIWVSTGLTQHAVIIAAVIGGSAMLIWLALRQSSVRLLWHQILASGVLTRGFTRQVATEQYCSTLAVLLDSGVPLADALTSAEATVTNLFIRTRLETVTLDVREGVALHTAMERTALFSPLLIVTIASGTQSSALPACLGRVALDQSDALKARTDALVALAEPLILLLMGGLVMLLVMAILLPIINLNSLVG